MYYVIYDGKVLLHTFSITVARQWMDEFAPDAIIAKELI
jgi:hypothetical protein